MKEIWKPIAGYEDLYKVSNYGKVIRLKKSYMVTKNRGVNLKEKVIKGEIDKYGYHVVVLTKNKAPKKQKVHRLVALNFIKNKKNKPQVNHIDGNRKNNIFSNLEWVTPQENSTHMKKCNRQAIGSRVGNSKLKEKDILEIRKSNFSNQKLSKLYKVFTTCIYKIKIRQTWKHV